MTEIHGGAPKVHMLPYAICNPPQRGFTVQPDVSRPGGHNIPFPRALWALSRLRFTSILRSVERAIKLPRQEFKEGDIEVPTVSPDCEAESALDGLTAYGACYPVKGFSVVVWGLVHGGPSARRRPRNVIDPYPQRTPLGVRSFVRFRPASS